MQLLDQVVWVTGASSGIGEALVPALLKEGAKVVVSARNAATLAQLVERHGADRVKAVPVDLTQAETLDAAVEQAVAAFGQVDVLVNNAGRSQRASALDTGMDEVRSLMELNFMAPVALTRALVPAMVLRGQGAIVIVSSVAGYVSTPHRSTYNATKFAVRGYFDALRAELHGTGVRVCVVVPGYIRTNITRSAVAGQGQAHGKTSDAIENGLSPEECAASIVRALIQDKPELHVGGKELAGIHLARLVPGLVRRLAPRFKPE